MNYYYVEDKYFYEFLAFLHVVLKLLIFCNFFIKCNFLVIILFKIYFCNISLEHELLLCRGQIFLWTFLAFLHVVLKLLIFFIKCRFLVIILIKMHFCNISLELLCKSQIIFYEHIKILGTFAESFWNLILTQWIKSVWIMRSKI